MENGNDTANSSLIERPLVRGVLAGVLLAALIGVFFIIRSNRSDRPESVRDGGSPVATASAQPDTGLGPLDSNPPLVGEPAPDFRLRDARGTVVQLSDLRGKVVYVNFWAEWCVPCRKELPIIQRIYDEKRANGFEVLTVNWKDDVPTATRFFSSRTLTLPLLLDADGAVYEQYKLRGLPDSFFIGRDGNIASLQYGEVTEENIRDRLRASGLP